MALLAETLVEEWLNRDRFFTIRGIRERVDEIDLLAVRPRDVGLEALHVEVQISFRPVSYLTPLTRHLARAMKKVRRSAVRRDATMLEECVSEWVGKKYHSPAKIRRRDTMWPGLTWSPVLVHGRVKESAELCLIEKAGVRLVPLEIVLAELCPNVRGPFTAAAGGDLADLIDFYACQRKDAAG